MTLNEALPPVGRYFEDGEQITFGSHKLTVIPTPGHTRGSVCFYCEQEHVMFTGDTLFKGSIGRTDFEGGSMLQIIQSLRMIAQMPDNIVVLSGHGEKTTLGFELAHNPYMDRSRTELSQKKILLHHASCARLFLTLTGTNDLKSQAPWGGGARTSRIEAQDC